MKQDIKQLKVICEKNLGEKLTEEDLFDIAERLKRLSTIAYKQILRENLQSTNTEKNGKI